MKSDKDQIEMMDRMQKIFDPVAYEKRKTEEQKALEAIKKHVFQPSSRYEPFFSKFDDEETEDNEQP